MNFPELAATTPLRAWCMGLAAALALEWVAVRAPFGLFAGALPLAAVVLGLYGFTVRPRLFAASGVLLGTLPLLTWGIVDGLMHCASFNRNGGSCQADPSAQVTIAITTYLATVVGLRSPFVAPRRDDEMTRGRCPASRSRAPRARRRR